MPMPGSRGRVRARARRWSAYRRRLGGSSSSHFQRAAQLTRASSQYLTSASPSTADLHGGATVWRAVHFYLDQKASTAADTFTLFDTYDGVAFTGMRCAISSGDDKILIGFGDGVDYQTSVFDAATATAGAWHHVYVMATGGNISISLDDAALEVEAQDFAGAGDVFTLGTQVNTDNYIDGRMQNFVGGDTVLTDAEQTALYGAGLGLAYAEAPAALAAKALFWLPLDEASGTRVCLIDTGNNLAAGGAAGSAVGLRG